ncbi:MAG: hypothetical protein K9G49_10560 [Taibaiella sp.]|nr:hypothetical protein [Taibaiella sp.]
MLVIFAFSCKKQEKATSPIIVTEDSTSNYIDSRDFMFIPMDSAKWRIHCQGTMRDTGSGFRWDTTTHMITTVVSTGRTYDDNSGHYHIFSATTIIFGIYKNDTILKPWSRGSDIYIKEDTLGKKVILSGTDTLDYNTKAGDIVKTFDRWPTCSISKIDSVSLNGKYYRRWVCTTVSGRSNFYMSYGIGGQMGILSKNYQYHYYYMGFGGEARSLDFIYKSDSIHFDYEYY